MADDVERRFEAAVNVVRSMPKKGSYQPSYETMLKFYGYFKQAKEGPCNESKPGFWDVVKKAKWDAWSSLGSISKMEAMEGYVKELQKVMETMPDTGEMADFSLVLQSFYEVVYQPTGEEPPHILHIFKKPASDNVVDDKCNGYHGDLSITDQQDFELYEQEQEIVPEQSMDKKLNGVHTNGNGDSTNGLHEENMEIPFVASNKEDIGNLVNGSHISQDTLSSSDLYIVEIKSERKGSNIDKEDSKEASNHHSNHVPSLKPGLSKANGKDQFDQLNSASDDSDEEFCDSLDPEHLSTLQSETINTNEAVLNEIPNDSTSTTCNSSASINSSEHHLTGTSPSDSDMSDVENEAQRYTSSPFEKKNGHVTFNTDDKASHKKTQSPRIANNENGGILKVRQAGSGYGGGDANRSSRQRMRGSYSQTRQQSASLQEGGRIPSTQMTSSGATGHSDSDSDDTNHNGESCDSSGERDEINERIVTALEKIQQDMNRVLRRLETMEDVMALRQERLHSFHRSESREQEPWWSQFLPSKTVAFLILWPFVINIIFYYWRKKKVQKFQ